MAIWIVCPGCKSAARDGHTFRIEEVQSEEPLPQTGEQLVSAAHLICVTCTLKFPLWTYTMGQSRSFVSNAENDDGSMWDPEDHEPWWSAGGPNLENALLVEEVVAKPGVKDVYFRG